MIFQQDKAIRDGKKRQTRRVEYVGDLLSTWTNPVTDVTLPAVYSATASGDNRLRFAVGKEVALVPKRGVAAAWRSPDGEVLSMETMLYRCNTDSVALAQRVFKGLDWQPERVRITGLYREKLQLIDEFDAVEEGVADVAEYQTLWEKINGDGLHAWRYNPTVWVVSFVYVT